MLVALGIAVAVSLIFLLGRWRGRADLLGDVPMKTRIAVDGELDAQGNMRVTVRFKARIVAAGVTIDGEQDMMVTRADWLTVFPRGR